jgi:polar amino acid transport system substrate-binding protein
MLMVGLNRRFAPMIDEIRAMFGVDEALQMVYRVNSGHIPATTWLHEEAEGGGMLVGEMCHFLDVMLFVCGEKPVTVYAQPVRVTNEMVGPQDNLTIVVGFDGGSAGTLNYNTIGDKAATKERLEVFGGGKVAILDDFRVLEKVAGGRRTRTKSSNQDKGQAQQLKKFVRALKEGLESPIPFDQLVKVMRIVFAAQMSMQSGQVIRLSARSEAPTVADARYQDA